MASISRKSSKKVLITILQMLLAERRTHKNKALFMGLRGVLWVRIMGSQNVMGLDYGSNISGDMWHVSSGTHFKQWWFT